ncbi:MAG: DUF4381 domain-containing protein [Coxiellaceae bacterium]|nr:DUF4381 domain-containing protein [Coxiellaceae bacterium]
MGKAPLSQLRDIHLPAAVSWWPLSIGWYIVGCLIILLLVVASIFIIKRMKRYALQREALDRLHVLKQHYLADSDNNATLGQLNKLLKQVAMTVYPDQAVANLQGDAWLAFLDKTGKTTQFTQGEGRCLRVAPYQKHAADKGVVLFELAQQWIRRQS